MNLEQVLSIYQQKYDIVEIINLDDWYSFAALERPDWLRSQLQKVHRPCYTQLQRIVMTLTAGDEYRAENDPAGIILTTLQELLNQLDISNFFVVIIAAGQSQIAQAGNYLTQISTDPIPLTFEYVEPFEHDIKRLATKGADIGYNYNSVRPLKIAVDQLTTRQQELLLTSKNFCMYPWLHLYVEPNGRVFPCCGTTYEDECAVGDASKTQLKEIWNSVGMKTIRLNMMNETPSAACTRFYEQEASGFFSMRNSANKHHGHHVPLINNTNVDGSVDQFKMIYWDVRFSNLCNLRCRSCGPSFSSSWYQDQLKLAPDYSKNHKALFYAGKYETDLWEQLVDHFDHVEQIYFAGGEPIMMDEHYRILEELERRGRFDVRLIYNTNFTQIKLKDRTVFDYWKKFDSVSVGASLDASGIMGEYIRKGTEWADVEHNRRTMQDICPNVDFYISATLSILNAWSLTDFHKDWTERGLIGAQDFNVNILTNPAHYRIDIAPSEYKQKLQQRYQQHLAWLTPLDHLRRASNGYQSAITFMNTTDNTHLLDTFWRKTHELDSIRKENWKDILPELQALL